MRVYIAGPYSIGDPIVHLSNALDVAEKVLLCGHIPFIPHLCMFWHLKYTHSTKTWYSYDLEWLKVCDAMIVIPGESIGTEKEIEFANNNSIAVYTIEQFLDYYLK